MNDRSTPNGATTSLHLNESQACDGCGRFGAVAIGDRHLCVDCFDTCGSCCQGSLLDNSDAG